MNDLNNFDKTGREYSLAATDDLIRLWLTRKVLTRGRTDQFSNIFLPNFKH